MNEIIELHTSDGHICYIPKNIAIHSKSICNILENKNYIENKHLKIMYKNISYSILLIIINFLYWKDSELHKPLYLRTSIDQYIKENVPNDLLEELLIASNFIDC